MGTGKLLASADLQEAFSCGSHVPTDLLNGGVCVWSWAWKRASRKYRR